MSENYELKIAIESRRDDLVKKCNLIDDKEQKVHHYFHFREFCQILYEHESKDDEDCFNEGDTVEEVLNVALLMNNYCYRIKVLKILLVYWNKKRILNVENYEEIKASIIASLCSDTSDSIFKVSENLITSNCNRMYFELIFLLKESRLKQFEFKFEEFIQMHKKNYGEYWKHAMKSDARILHQTAETRQYYKTIEFIFQKCSFIELNCTILTEFEELSEFNAIFKDFLNKEQKEFVVIFKYFNLIK